MEVLECVAVRFIEAAFSEQTLTKAAAAGFEAIYNCCNIETLGSLLGQLSNVWQ
jgi:hypothetical protein